MAPSTDRRFTRLLMFEAVPYSSANILATRDIWSLGGIMREIMLVPLLKSNKSSGSGNIRHMVKFCTQLSDKQQIPSDDPNYNYRVDINIEQHI